MASNTLSASRPGAGSVVVTTAVTIATQIVGVGVVGQAGVSSVPLVSSQYAVTVIT